jgi:hypothetical protein
MMCQFQVMTCGDVRYLTVTDISHWDYFYGFQRIIKRLP